MGVIWCGAADEAKSRASVDTRGVGFGGSQPFVGVIIRTPFW
jgi:hypothetical protein